MGWLRPCSIALFVVHSLKLIFIAVPATGSTSFTESINRRIGKQSDWAIYHADWQHPARKLHPEVILDYHFTAEQARIVIADDSIWNGYEKIAFVREPYAWTRSIWRKLGATEYAVGIDCTGTYLEFLEKLEKTPYFWFTDSTGKVLVDNIYRTEDLEEVFRKYDLPYRHSNKTPQSQPETERTSEVDGILRKKFWREYKHYPETPKLDYSMIEERNWMV